MSFFFSRLIFFAFDDNQNQEESIPVVEIGAVGGGTVLFHIISNKRRNYGKNGDSPCFSQNGEAEYLAVYQQLNGIIDAISKSIKKRRKTEAV